MAQHRLERVRAVTTLEPELFIRMKRDLVRVHSRFHINERLELRGLRPARQAA